MDKAASESSLSHHEEKSSFLTKNQRRAQLRFNKRQKKRQSAIVGTGSVSLASLTSPSLNKLDNGVTTNTANTSGSSVPAKVLTTQVMTTHCVQHHDQDDTVPDSVSFDKSLNDMVVAIESQGGGRPIVNWPRRFNSDSMEHDSNLAYHEEQGNHDAMDTSGDESGDESSDHSSSWDTASDDSSASDKDGICFNKACNNQGALDVSAMPLLVVQEMDLDFPLADKEKTNLDYQGGLHPKHSQYISRIHVVHPCQQQLYIVKDLHRHVHYSIAAANLPLFKSHCNQVLQAKEDYIEYCADQSYTNQDKFLQVWNGGTPEFDSVLPFFNLLDLVKLMYPWFRKTKVQRSRRNNFLISGGFTGVSLKKDSLHGVHEAKPQQLKYTSKFRQHFILMSDLARKLKQKFVGVLEEGEENEALLNAFHRLIDPLNLFSGCTVGVYEDPDQLLQMHADISNAKQEGHNVRSDVSECYLCWR